MQLTESCVIEQHVDRLLKSVEPADLVCGGADIAHRSRLGERHGGGTQAGAGRRWCATHVKVRLTEKEKEEQSKTSEVSRLTKMWRLWSHWYSRSVLGRTRAEARRTSMGPVGRGGIVGA